LGAICGSLYYHEVDFDAIGGVLYCHESCLGAICGSLYYHEVDYGAIGGVLYCHVDDCYRWNILLPPKWILCCKEWCCCYSFVARHMSILPCSYICSSNNLKHENTGSYNNYAFIIHETTFNHSLINSMTHDQH